MTAVDRSSCTGRRHGDRLAYWNSGCRCVDARQNANAWHVRRRSGSLPPRQDRVSALGARRRLRALVALGWSTQRLAERLGISSSLVQRWLHQNTIHSRNRDAIEALYEALEMALPPNDHSSAQARRYAEAQSWSPPLAWDSDTIDDPEAEPVGIEGGEPADDFVDWVAVQRAFSGEKVRRRLTMAERLVTIYCGDQQGKHTAAIAKATGQSGSRLAQLRQHRSGEIDSVGRQWEVYVR